MAALAAPVNDPVYLVELNVAERGGRFDSVDDRLRFGVVGMFRLVRGVLQDDSRTSPAAVAAASVAALVYAANPNLIYMQATAMTESIYLALFIWAVVYFSEFLRALKKHKEEIGSSTFRTALTRCAACLAGAELTRYDGWFLAGAVGSAVLLLWLRNRDDKAFRRATIRFLAGIALVPILWLAYNRVVYSNAFEFANGPYSAKAIEERVAAPNPALHDIPVAAIYFLKSAHINVANGNWGRFWLFAVIIALAAIIWNRKTQAPLLLLWVPLPFYALSIAYGSVPAPRLYVVAIRDLQPALWPPIVTIVCSLGWNGYRCDFCIRRQASRRQNNRCRP